MNRPGVDGRAPRQRGTPRGQGPARRQRPRAIVTNGLLSLTPIVLAIVIWHYVATVVLDRPMVYPTPASVLNRLGNIVTAQGGLNSPYTDFYQTIIRILIAVAFTLVVGTLIGVVCGRFPIVYELLSVPLWAFMAIPEIVWVFLIVLIMGLSASVPIIAVSMVLVPLVVISVAEGTKAMDAELNLMAQSYRASTFQKLHALYLPALLPYIFGSLRVIFALGVKVMVVAEVIGTSSGIGFELSYSFGQLDVANVIAWGIILIIFGAIVDSLILAPASKRLVRWRT